MKEAEVKKTVAEAPKNTDDIYSAMLKIQSELSAISKDNVGDTGKYKYKYADLIAVNKEIKPVMTKHGVVAIQNLTYESGYENNEVKTILETNLVHVKSKTVVKSSLPLSSLNTRMQGMQTVGDAITYARRYSLVTMLNLDVEDNDAKPAKEENYVVKPKPQAEEEII